MLGSRNRSVRLPDTSAIRVSGPRYIPRRSAMENTVGYTQSCTVFVRGPRQPMQTDESIADVVGMSKGEDQCRAFRTAARKVYGGIPISIAYCFHGPAWRLPERPCTTAPASGMCPLRLTGGSAAAIAKQPPAHMYPPHTLLLSSRGHTTPKRWKYRHLPLQMFIN